MAAVLAIVLLAAGVAVTEVHAASAAERASELKTRWRDGLIRRGADGRLTLDTSPAAIRESRHNRIRAHAAGRRACPAVAPGWLRGLVDKMAPAYRLDPELVVAVMAVESGFRAKAVSPKSAQGLMQLIPSTARRFGVRNPFNPADNLRGGLRYLRWLLDHFGGNLTHALAGYNAGEHAVTRHKGVPPYRETQLYVKAVKRLYGCARSTPKNQPATSARGAAFATPWSPTSIRSP